MDFLPVPVVFFVFKFVVVLLLVVQGGTVYLPMPPTWPEVTQHSLKQLHILYLYASQLPSEVKYEYYLYLKSEENKA